MKPRNSQETFLINFQPYSKIICLKILMKSSFASLLEHDVLWNFNLLIKKFWWIGFGMKWQNWIDNPNSKSNFDFGFSITIQSTKLDCNLDWAIQQSNPAIPWLLVVFKAIMKGYQLWEIKICCLLHLKWFQAGTLTWLNNLDFLEWDPLTLTGLSHYSTWLILCVMFLLKLYLKILDIGFAVVVIADHSEHDGLATESWTHYRLKRKNAWPTNNFKLFWHKNNLKKQWQKFGIRVQFDIFPQKRYEV